MKISGVHIIGKDDENILSRFPDEQGHIVIMWEKESDVR